MNGTTTFRGMPFYVVACLEHPEMLQLASHLRAANQREQRVRAELQRLESHRAKGVDVRVHVASQERLLAVIAEQRSGTLGAALALYKQLGRKNQAEQNHLNQELAASQR